MRKGVGSGRGHLTCGKAWAWAHLLLTHTAQNVLLFYSAFDKFLDNGAFSQTIFCKEKFVHL